MTNQPLYNPNPVIETIAIASIRANALMYRHGNGPLAIGSYFQPSLVWLHLVVSANRPWFQQLQCRWLAGAKFLGRQYGEALNEFGSGTWKTI